MKKAVKKAVWNTIYDIGIALIGVIGGAYIFINDQIYPNWMRYSAVVIGSITGLWLITFACIGSYHINKILCGRDD